MFGFEPGWSMALWQECCNLPYRADVLICLAVLSLERLFYGMVYHYPESFQRMCQHSAFIFLWEVVQQARGRPSNPETDLQEWKVAQFISNVFKVLQVSFVGYDVVSKLPDDYTRDMVVSRVVAGLVLIFFGQALNLLVYRRIGAKGVYYGSQLGYEVPWCDKFPFGPNGIPDPQYTGVIATVWGVYFIFGRSWGFDHSWYIVPIVETFWYVMSMVVLEHHKGLRGLSPKELKSKLGRAKKKLKRVESQTKEAARFTTQKLHEFKKRNLSSKAKAP